MKKILLSSLVTFGLYANAQVNVTATAGTPSATYTTLKQSFDAINAGTHQGDIKLDITANTTESAMAVLNAVTTYTSVVIKPSAVATISGAVNNNPLVKILGSNVTIDGSVGNGGTTKDLTITNTGATAPSTVFMGSTSSATPLTNVVVKNSIFSNGGTNSTNFILANGSTAAGYFNNITIENNEIKSGYNGIYVLGNTAATNGNNVNIKNNTLSSIIQNGIYFGGVNGSATISNNNITVSRSNAGTTTTPSGSFGLNLGAGANNTTVSGNTFAIKHTATSGVNYASAIYISSGNTNIMTNVHNNKITEVSGFLTYVDSSAIAIVGATSNAKIYSNQISGLKNTNTGSTPMQGILLGSSSTAANALVYNNVITDILATNNGLVSGIYVFNGAGYKIYNNSIHLNTSNNETGISTALHVLGNNVTAANALDVRNNIFANSKPTGSRYAIYSTSPKTVFSNLDYNNYSTNDETLASLEEEDFATLAEIQTAFGGNANSLAITPEFTSLTDLHLLAGANEGLDNKGLALADVTTDFDGVTRSTTPDMGAYEFTFDPSMSVTDVKKAEIKIFPNPVSEYFTIKTNQKIDNVEIYSMEGKLIKSVSINSESATINVQELPVGLYIGKIIANGKVETVKIMKK